MSSGGRAPATARASIHRLRERTGQRFLKTPQQVQTAVDKILDETAARPWLHVALVPRPRHHHKQDRRGRPGPHTRYVRLTTTVYEPVATVDADAVRRSAATDGIFFLVSDLPADKLSTLELLQTYKYQAFIEKRHEQLKTAAAVVPVNFKSPERIEAFLFLYFLAVTLHALIERQIRRAMAARGLRTIPLYPEERQCRAPTADKILQAFEPLRKHHLFRNDRLVQPFAAPLSDIQTTLLDLLDIPTSV